MPNHRPGTASLHRINLDAEIILLNEAQSWTLKLVDISLKGALIEQPVNWDGQLSEHYQLQINPGDGNTCITMDTTIVHIEDNPIDQHCEHFDVDSINRFRRLVEVEFNIGDDFLLKCELSAMIQ